MVLAIDIGNTRVKAGIFLENILKEVVVFPFDQLESEVKRLISAWGITKVIAVSVAAAGAEAFAFLPETVAFRFMDRTTPLPFAVRYKTPDTLGLDRMVLASGSVLAYPGANRLVIDAGTCITYDFTDAQDLYQGGAISPGLLLRYKALHQYAARLPLLSPKMPADFIGDSTGSSIHSGVVNGVLGEIEGFVSRYAARYDNFTIILTGGDADFLAKRLKNTIFAHSNFLLESLYRLYLYAAKHDE